MYTLTDKGEKKVALYIQNLVAKRKEILDAGKDTADETSIPTVDDIVSDVNAFGVDEDGDYYNSFGCTDHYDSDAPLGLTLNEDIKEVAA